MHWFLFTLIPALVQCASYYNSYSTSYPSSTISNLNNNFPYKSVSYTSDIANFPEATRYPNYSPGYGYGSSPGYGYGSSSGSGYGSTPGYGHGSTPGYGYGSTRGYSSGYSSTGYPSYNSGYSTSGYNSLYSGSSGNMNYNQRYGESSGGYGSGSSYGSNNGYSNSGTGYGSGSTYGSNNGYSNSGTAYGSGSTYGSNNGYSNSGTAYGSESSYGSNNGYSNSGAGYGSTLGSGGYTAYEAPFMRDMGSCVNRSPQSGIWVEQLMGFWYGVEYIQHLGADSRIDFTYTCIVIHLSEPKQGPSTENQVYHVQHINAKFRHDYRHLRLLWDEAGHTTEYALYFRNDTAGYWHVYDGQNGTLPNMPSYQQFGGTVQVLKAVNDHLVLNFCQEGINGRSPQLYSVLFSRRPGELNRWEKDSVHSMLQNKKLSTSSRRMVCGNSSDKPMYSIGISFMTCVLAYVLGSSS